MVLDLLVSKKVVLNKKVVFGKKLNVYVFKLVVFNENVYI